MDWQCKIRLGWFISCSQSFFYFKRSIPSGVSLTNQHLLIPYKHDSHVTLEATKQAHELD
jgi:hypothetical protein